MRYSKEIKQKALDLAAQNYVEKGKVLAQQVKAELKEEFDRVPSWQTIRNWAKDIIAWEKDKMKVKQDSEVIQGTIQTERILTPTELIEKMDIDKDKWELSDIRFGKHEWMIKNEDTQEPEIVELFNMRVKFKLNTLAIDKDAAIKAVNDISVDKFSDLKELEYTDFDPNIDYVVNGQDLHFGKLAYKEISWEDYNMSEAKRRLHQCVDDTIKEIQKSGKPDKITLTIGGDWLHIDSPNNSTTSGTPQDVDGLYEVAKSRLIELRMEVILKLRTVAPVHVVSVKGNHDKYSSVDVARQIHSDIFKAIVSNMPNVEVAEAIDELDVKVEEWMNPWQAYKEWNNLFVFNHWDNYTSNSKRKTIPGEVRKRFSHKIDEKTKIYVFMWHLHSNKKYIEQDVDSIHWVQIFYSQSVSWTDMWHNEKWYVGNTKWLQTYKFHKEKWQVGEIHSNI